MQNTAKFIAFATAERAEHQFKYSTTFVHALLHERGSLRFQVTLQHARIFRIRNAFD